MVGNRSSTKGRQRKVTAREERYILRVLPNSPKSLRKVQGELDLNVCKSTIRNVMKRSGIIVRQKMVKVLEMMPHHKTTRLCPTLRKTKDGIRNNIFLRNTEDGRRNRKNYGRRKQTNFTNFVKQAHRVGKKPKVINIVKAVYLERALILKSSPFTNLERPDGSTTYNRPEIRKLVLTHFSNLYAATTREPRSRYTHPDDPEILQHEVEHAIVTSKTNISPGPDEITFLQLKLGNESIAPHLTAALNQVLTNGRTSEDWKTVKIYLLPKTTKPKKLKDYRPVALS
uniref:Transposable element Tc3 transposase-like DNA-binding HTH domain-containing protein n=2 Tax=Caenorhabditis japonica TaxID=281687 RepID=A0A8R1IB84_CAEJA